MVRHVVEPEGMAAVWSVLLQHLTDAELGLVVPGTRAAIVTVLKEWSVSLRRHGVNERVM